MGLMAKTQWNPKGLKTHFKWGFRRGSKLTPTQMKKKNVVLSFSSKEHPCPITVLRFRGLKGVLPVNEYD